MGSEMCIRDRLRAVLSVTIGGAYAIHGLKLYETEKGGLFLSMPSQSYEADGETKYTQIFHPITAHGREYLEKAAHLAYHMALESQKQEERLGMELQP